MTAEELRPVELPHSVRELGPVDISSLAEMIGRLSETVWNQENARKDNQFEVFHDTRHIVFRFLHDPADPRLSHSKPIWEVWRPILLPVIESAIESYGFEAPEFPKVMLARLAAGHAIDSHVDGNESNRYTHKIHVPIETNPTALFCSNGQSHHLREGVAYEVNNVAPHAAENLGETDRIHLIFEVFDNSRTNPVASENQPC